MRWTMDNTQSLAEEPVEPEHLDNRDLNNWEPLFHIAQVIGGEWPGMIATACSEYFKESRDATDVGYELLDNIRSVFKEQAEKAEEAKADQAAGAVVAQDFTTLDGVPDGNITPGNLAHALAENENWGWCEYKLGNPITNRQLAARLRVFNIVTRENKIGKGDSRTSVRSYCPADFTEAFETYLAEEESPFE